MATKRRSAVDGVFATTLDLINYAGTWATNAVIVTDGFATVGDGGGGSWKKTGNTGTASQSPAQRGNATLTDANGNEFELVVIDKVCARALGAVPDYDNVTQTGTDSTLPILAAIAAAVTKKKVAYLGPGDYLITDRIGDQTVSESCGFVGAGIGITNIYTQFTVLTSAVRFFNKTGFVLSGFSVIGNYYLHGSTVSQGIDCAHITDGIIENLKVKDVSGQGAWCISGDDTITNDNVHMRNISVEQCGSSGIQLQGAKNSGISDSSAVNVGIEYLTNGMSGSGVYFKVPIIDCYHDNNYAEDATIGAFNVGSSFPAEQGKRLRFSNGSAVNCKRGIRIGNVIDSSFDNFYLGLDGGNSNGSGDGIRLESSVNNTFTNIGISNTGNSRAAVRLIGTAEGNYIHLTSFKSPVAGAFVMSAEAGTLDNQVVVNRKKDPTSGVEITNSGIGNSYEYVGAIRNVNYTLSSNAITLDNVATHKVLLSTEGGIAVDTLNTINGGVDGQVLYLATNLDSQDVTLADTGNLQLGGNFTLNTASDTITLMYNSRVSRWVEISRSDNA